MHPLVKFDAEERAELDQGFVGLCDQVLVALQVNTIRPEQAQRIQSANLIVAPDVECVAQRTELVTQPATLAQLRR